MSKQLSNLPASLISPWCTTHHSTCPLYGKCIGVSKHLNIVQHHARFPTDHQVSAILNIYGHHDHNGCRGIFCSHTYIFFLILREQREKKTKEDGLLFPGVFFFFIRGVRFFGPLPIFILILLFPLRFFLHFSGDEWGYFLRIQPHCEYDFFVFFFEFCFLLKAFLFLQNTLF